MPFDTLRQRFATLSRPTRILFSSILLFAILAILSRPFSSKSSSSNFPTFPQDDYTYPAEPHHKALAQARPKRVAIIGAGASGSGSAFFLRRAGRVMEDRIGVPEGTLLGEIVVFDREGYVGGRE